MMMTCPDPGSLRAGLDGERPDVATHVTQCASCQTRSAAIADDATFAAARFGVAPSIPDAEVGAALDRAQDRTAAAPLTVLQPRRYGAGLLRAAAAVLAVVLVGGVLSTSGGRAAAASFLEQFRADRVTAVPVDFAAIDPAALQALAGLADIQGLEDAVDPQRVTNLDAAADIAGFRATPLDRTALPPNATGEMVVLAQDRHTVRITFKQVPAVPAEIRGVTLVLRVPSAVVQGVGDGDRPVAVRGEAEPLEVYVEGDASLAQVRDALLGLPGLPEKTVAALRAIEEWQTTLPLPVPVGHVTWDETTVAGRPGLAFGDESGIGSALVWHDGRRFVGVGGTMPLSQLRALAEGGE